MFFSDMRRIRLYILWYAPAGTEVAGAGQACTKPYPAVPAARFHNRKMFNALTATAMP